MRILRLGSSIDLEGETPEDQRASSIAAEMLSAACGEPVETILRLPWPSASMADSVEGWIHETTPDLVCFNVSSFWCESEVVAERLSDFGPIGRMLSRWLNRSTKNYEFNASWLVRAGRSLAAHTVGGRPPFEPGAAAESLEQALRRVLRHEHIGVVVCGSPFSASLEGGPAARRRARNRRGEFFGRVAKSCDRLLVPYDLPPHAADAFSKALRTRDGLHFGSEMHRRCGEMQGRLMVTAWERTSAIGRRRA